MAASMGEVNFPGLGARLPSAAVNSVILEAYVIPGYEKPTDQEVAILDFLKGRDVFVFFPTRAGKSRSFATLPSALLLSIRLQKKDLPRCRNTQHSVALPSCPYKIHTSLFPPVLRNQNWLPGQES